MITDPDLVDALIESTIDLIDQDGQDIALTRKGWIETPAGGVTPGAPVSLPAVRRFFGATTTDGERVIRDEGEQLVLDHILVGLPGDDIQEKDTFEISDRKFEVLEVDPETNWQVKAWVIERN